MPRRKKKQRSIVYSWVAALVALLLTFAVHVFSRQDRIQQTDAEWPAPQQQLPAAESADWSRMPDSVAVLCTPSPLQRTPEQVLRRTAYVVSYNKETRCPNWVAWQLTADHVDGPLKRMNNFHEDDDCPLPRATLHDYRGSGWSRGHMCPAGDNKWSRQAMYDSFSLVNVCPQSAKLNSGLWNSLEMDCRRWARKYGHVYIVCGPVWSRGRHLAIGPNEVMVPGAFFKVVLCMSGRPKAFGVVVRNNDGTRKRDLYYNSVDQVERITGLDFFPSLPDHIERQVEATADMSEW